MIEIEGLPANLYSYSYSKIDQNENEAKLILKLNFEISFNNTPLLTMTFHSQNIIQN